MQIVKCKSFVRLMGTCLTAMALTCVGTISGFAQEAATSSTAPDASQKPVTTVELLGTVTAHQVANGLGFNLDDNSEWEFAAASAAGATHARMQCAWVTVEQQTAPPRNVAASPRYVQDPNCIAGFASAKRYGIHPTVVAAYGPPYHQILTVTIPGGAAVGATSLDVVLVSGVGGDTLSNIAYPYDYIQGPPHQAPNYGVFTAAGSYQGAFITGVKVHDGSHATLKLASAVTTALPANSTQYFINEILYPSAATTSPKDPSVLAFGDYVSFLATSMADAGVSGDVEIWNEPPWNPDPWDNRGTLYDADLWPGAGKPGPTDQGEPNYGFVANLQNKTFPSGITLTWDGTSGNGEASILAPSMFAQSGVYANQPAKVITSESFHPYGTEPEQFMFETSCLQATAKLFPAYPGGIFTNCYLPGESTSTNLMAAVQYSMIAKLQNASYGVAHSITETGILPPKAGLRAAQARFIMRQYLGFQAEGITPVQFFKLYDATAPNDPNFSFVEYTGGTSYKATPAYTALSGFMADIKPISNGPVSTDTAAKLASVASYSGTFPLTTVHMVGSRANASANSEMFTVWQRTYTRGVWLEMLSPAAAAVAVAIPAGTKVSSVINLDTRAAVTYKQSGQKVTFNVADDPIAVLIDPTGGASVSTKLNLKAAPASTTYGGQLTLAAALSPHESSGHDTNGEAVSFYKGSTKLGVGTLSSGNASITVSSLPAGTASITAEYAGDTYLAASSGATSVVVSAKQPSISFAGITDEVYGNPPFEISANSASSGAFTYSVVSGPAKISGRMITLTGTGNVSVQASQAASGNYTAASARKSFSVSAATLASTTVSLQLANTHLVYPQQAGFLTTVAQSGKEAPTGSVKLLDGSKTVGTYSLQYFTEAYAYGSFALNVGSHALTVLYSGDKNYVSTKSPTVTVVVAAK